MIMKSHKSKDLQSVSQEFQSKHEWAPDPGRMMFPCDLKVEKKWMPRFDDSEAGGLSLYLSGRVSLFALYSPSTDWMKPTHIRENNLIYSVYGFKC